jgi:hypothetical protein
MVEKVLPQQFKAEAKLLDNIKKGDRKDFHKMLMKVVDQLEKSEAPAED